VSWARTAGGSPVYFSTSTRHDVDGPRAIDDVPRSCVSTFGLPLLHIPPGSIGSHHAPVGSWTTPSIRSCRIATAARHAPRSLNTRTRSPGSRSRAVASSGVIPSCSLPSTFASMLVSPWSHYECSRVFG
jgi:hypothetical protein